jgi:putative phage-type endonuclease
VSVQGTQEWIEERLGKATASRIADIVAKTKTGYSTSRANYMAELITERLTGVQTDQYINSAMKWGTDTEPQARAAYAFYSDASVEQVGFVPHPKIAMSGASPDGLVSKIGLVEFKCPLTATHIETLLGGSLPGRYLTQAMWQMACKPERKWCDCVSFDPRLPENMRLFVQRVPRDNKMIAELEGEVVKFLGEIDSTITDLEKRYGKVVKAAA